MVHKTRSRLRWYQVPHRCVSSVPVAEAFIKGITEVQRDAIIQKIFDADVSVNVHFIPLAMLSFYKNRGYNISNYPVTYDNYSREISLPIFYDLTEEMLKRIVDAVTNAIVSTLS